jgi:hypothetical protein
VPRLTHARPKGPPRSAEGPSSDGEYGEPEKEAHDEPDGETFGRQKREIAPDTVIERDGSGAAGVVHGGSSTMHCQ